MKSFMVRASSLLAIAALGVAGLVLAPSAASAQTYVLTFDATVACQPTYSVCPTSQQINTSYGSQAGTVDGANGIVPSFGSSSGTAGNIDWYDGGCCGEASGDGIGYANTSTGDGVFEFVLIGSGSITLNSLDLGYSAADQGGTGSADGEVFAYTDLTGIGSPYIFTGDIAGGQHANTPPDVVSPGICGNQVLILEWGSADGSHPTSDFSIDDINYTVSSSPCGSTAPPANVSPEPGVMTMLAFGLIGLAPMARRRRLI